MKRILLLALLLIPFQCLAQTTRTAASSNESDVATTVAASSSGDTVQIPCSPSTVTWTSTINVTASITITALGATSNSGPSTFGAGTNCLTILDNNGSGPLFNLEPTYSASSNVTVLQNMNLDPINSSTSLYSPLQVVGVSTSSGFPQVRIDNIYFGKSTPWTESGNSSNSVDMIRWAEAVGVMDHNTIPTGSTSNHLYSAQMATYLGVGQYGDNSWAQPDTMGTYTAAFAENNVTYINASTFNDCTEAPPGGGQTSGGCRIVNRFNHATGYNMFDFTAVHGLDTTGRPRSGRHTEAYGNTVNCLNNCADSATSFRGGTGIVFGNTATVTSPGFYDQIFDFTVYRVVYNPAPWSYCGGLNALDPWDTNDNTVYYSGTVSSGAGGYTITTSISGLPNLAPSGAPYSVYDTTRGFVTQITSNTTNTITVQPPIGENLWAFNNGDSLEIIRSTVCADQAGRGQGNYISGFPTPSPASALNEALDPIYEWDDVSNTTASQFGSSYSGGILQNRDFYTDNWKAGGLSGPTAQTSSSAPFNGTTTCNAGSGNYTCGGGFGTLAHRPASAAQVGLFYWATDQGSWNTSGNGFGQGELYVWNGSAWAANYGGNSSGQPAGYPHPLAGGTAVSLTVSAGGTGTGTISGSNCASNFYGSGTTIGPCAATPTGTSTFTGWTGTGNASACTGTGTCGPFNLTSTSTVVANFAAGPTQAATPVITPATGTYSGAQSTSITCSTPSSAINYTLDGSTPTTGSTLYSAPFTIFSTTTVKAVCNAAGFSQSNVATSIITITTPSCGDPSQNGPPTNPTYNFSNTFTCSGSTCTSSAGTSAYPLLIGFTSPTAGCSMFMTLDGSAPTCSSTAYSPQSLTVTTTMRVIACQASFTSSAIVGGAWTIIIPPPPATTIPGAVLNSVVLY